MIDLRRALRVLSVALFAPFALHHGHVRAAEPIKLGLVLPYSSVYASLGDDITRGLELALAEANNRVAGRSFEVLKQDSQVNPQVALQVTRKFITQDRVDFLIGPVASHEAIAMSKPARDSGTFLIIANAGADQLTRELCSPYIFRTSFSNWQPYYPMGPAMAKAGIKRVALLAPNYAAGKEALAAFKEGFLPTGGEVTSEQYPALGEADYQPYLSKVSQGGPQAVFVFFSGSDAVKFVQQYAQAGLNQSIPLYASGFLVEGDMLAAQGDAALGIKTTLHWADTLDSPANQRFMAAYRKKFGVAPSLFSVQGYDTGQLLIAALKITGGDTSDKPKLRRALEQAKIESPRGPFRLSNAHNPVQNIYLREVVRGSDGQLHNRVLGLAAEMLADPATGCDMPAQ
jgi:branched-chain amino acid transport system substrate-binding protein